MVGFRARRQLVVASYKPLLSRETSRVLLKEPGSPGNTNLGIDEKIAPQSTTSVVIGVVYTSNKVYNSSYSDYSKASIFDKLYATISAPFSTKNSRY
jgi:hypothetical protein